MIAMFRKKMLELIYNKPLTVLVIFFLISVAVRLPNFNRALSKHHELNCALVLINAEEWNNKTPAFYNYVPVHSYHQPGDDVYNEGSKGNKYLVNVSFGALWYIMPYQFFRLLHEEPSPLLLQVFNLLLHVITVVLIYLIVLYFFKSENNGRHKALLTSIFYMFSPSPLWFHGNGYVHEVAVLPFIYGAVLLYISIRHRNSFKLYTFLLSLIIMAGICCDWLMCFVAAAMFIITLADHSKKRLRSDLLLLFVITIGVLGGVFLTFWQFSSFMGVDNYVNGLLSRFLVRGIKGTAEGGGLSKGTGIGSFYLLGYGLLIPLVTFSIILIKSYKKHIVSNTRVKNFILIASIVCLFHHLLFWGFTNIHDYAVIKAGLIICLLSTIAIWSLNGINKRLIFFFAVITFNTGLYYYINPPGKYAANGQPYSYFKDLGEQIKTIAKSEDYIFIDTPEMSLLLTYYSKRLYRNVKDLNEAQLFFKALPGKNALYIHTSNFKFVHYTRLNK